MDTADSEIGGFSFLEPWIRVGEDSAQLDEELRREVAPGHPLFGLIVRAIARRVDSDDVLFRIDASRHRFAVVHLTWTNQPEKAPIWPRAELFASLDEWGKHRMLPDGTRRSD